MIEACRQFLAARLKEIRMPDGATAPYTDAGIFFGDMPRDWLKDNAYGANCLMLQDRKKKDGRLIGRVRNAACTHYTLTRRRYSRAVLFRCFLYAENFSDLWGNSDFKGFADQMELIAAGHRVMADAENNSIRIELFDAVRPWGGAESETRRDRVRRRPHQAIVRIQFTGGIHTTHTVPIVPSVEFTPDYY